MDSTIQVSPAMTKPASSAAAPDPGHAQRIENLLVEHLQGAAFEIKLISPPKRDCGDVLYRVTVSLPGGLVVFIVGWDDALPWRFHWVYTAKEWTIYRAGHQPQRRRRKNDKA